MVLKTHSPLTIEDVDRNYRYGMGWILVAPYVYICMGLDMVKYDLKVVYGTYHLSTPLGPDPTYVEYAPGSFFYDFSRYHPKTVRIPLRYHMNLSQGRTTWEQVNKAVDYLRTVKQLKFF